ncbi:MAG: PrsW family intramembrane metalloprotease [Flavobacteriales bacterium]|nr:PrsW family intramembrane metalloprotease [Flavobacteriales bacterium]
MWLLALAIAPGIAISIYIYWKDKYDKEPARLLIAAFLWGIASTIPTLMLEGIVEGAGIFHQTSLVKTAIYSFAGIGLIEELCKFLFVYIFLFPKAAFDEPFDGITYSVLVAMGFATLENIAYVVDNGLSTAIVRMFTAVPAHAAFGVIMGFFMGLAKFDKSQSNTYLAYAVFVPAILHAAYDFPLILSISQTPEWIGEYKILGAFITLIIAIWLSRRAIKIHQYNSPFK